MAAVDLILKASYEGGAAFGQARGDLDGLESKSKSVAESLGSTGKAMQGVGLGLTAGVTAPLVAAGLQAVSWASDLNESTNKVNVVFGDQSAAILAWSETSATALGQSQQQALEAAGTFGNLFTSMGLGKEKSADMSTGLVELASDLASFNNIDPTEALEKLRAGLLGESEPLRSLGVNLSAAAIEQQAFAMGLGRVAVDSNKVADAQYNYDRAQARLTETVKKHGAASSQAAAASHAAEKAQQKLNEAQAGGTLPLTAAAKAQAAYALILEQTQNAQGDFANTAAGAANAERILTAQVHDAVTMFGQQLLPIKLKVIEAATKLVTWFRELSPAGQKLAFGIGIAAAALGPLVFGIGTVLTILPALGSGLALLLGPVGLIAAGAALLGVAWVKNWGDIQGKTQAVIDFLRPGFETLLGWMKAAVGGDFNPLVNGLKGAFDSAVTFGQQAFTSFVGGLGETLAAIGISVANFEWADFVTALNDWGVYIPEIDWAGIVTTLGDWGSYITSLDWGTIFTTAVDWASFVVALDWNLFVKTIDLVTQVGSFLWSEFIAPINWGAVAGTGVSWGSYITSLDWGTIIASAPTWGTYIKEFAWDHFVSKLTWPVIAQVAWSDYISKLSWTTVVTTFEGWGTWITSLDWTKIITTTIDWATWVPALAWNTVVKGIDLATYVVAFVWSEWISKFEWKSVASDSIAWGTYISNLKWTDIVTAFEGWGTYVTKFSAWSDYIVDFAWESFVSKLEWPAIATVSWGDWVPKLKWPTISWPGFSTYVARLTWPSISWPGFATFVAQLSWPTITWPGWRSFIPNLIWPDVTGMINDAINSWNPFGGDGNAVGDGHYQGGMTMVGEAGPERVYLPKGSRILSNRETQRQEMAPVYVTVNATVNSALDMERMAYQVAKRVQEMMRR
ncbi:MAG: hypothetical protein ACOH2M_09765 [Cypionkella sp.]